jgi:hypothetical protein
VEGGHGIHSLLGRVVVGLAPHREAEGHVVKRCDQFWQVINPNKLVTLIATEYDLLQGFYLPLGSATAGRRVRCYLWSFGKKKIEQGVDSRFPLQFLLLDVNVDVSKHILVIEYIYFSIN